MGFKAFLSYLGISSSKVSCKRRQGDQRPLSAHLSSRSGGGGCHLPE